MLRFRNWKLKVCVALITVSSVCGILSAGSPLGISIAILGLGILLTCLMNDAAQPVIGRLMPVPKIASIIMMLGGMSVM